MTLEMTVNLVRLDIIPPTMDTVNNVRRVCMQQRRVSVNVILVDQVFIQTKMAPSVFHAQSDSPQGLCLEASAHYALTVLSVEMESTVCRVLVVHRS